MLWLLLAVFVVNIAVLARVSVFRVERVWERRVRGEQRVPLFTSPTGLNIDALRPENYSPEGRRLFPLLVVAQLCWWFALFAYVFVSI